jgi:hypothetical protein
MNILIYPSLAGAIACLFIIFYVYLMDDDRRAITHLKLELAKKEIEARKQRQKKQ